MSPAEQGIKLRHLTIRNFKAFDHFEIDFPPPLMEVDPDVMVLGSRNGLGKTSVLEAAAMLFLAVTERLEESEDIATLQRILKAMIRSGAKEAVLGGKFSFDTDECDVSCEMSGKSGTSPMLSGNMGHFRRCYHELTDSLPAHLVRVMSGQALLSLASLNPEPVILPGLMYFHSNRKIQEGSIALRTLVEGGGAKEGKQPISAFKSLLLRLLMSKAKLFEEIEERDAQEALDRLNGFLEEYAAVTISKLRPSPDDSIEFRIQPIDGGESYAFDALSSGQKEIISTLFLIWYYSKGSPAIVLIDEPDLHLNAEWHHDFVRQVHELAPHNQYILATHSEDIFASVPEDRRLLLVPSGTTKEWSK